MDGIMYKYTISAKHTSLLNCRHAESVFKNSLVYSTLITCDPTKTIFDHSLGNICYLLIIF